jgi:hypothetical protein
MKKEQGNHPVSLAVLGYSGVTGKKPASIKPPNSFQQQGFISTPYETSYRQRIR